MTDRPDQPEFWDVRYEAGRTPWDLGGPPAALIGFLAAHPGKGRTVLIPGCGTGREIEAFASAGYRVTAIDFSPPAVAQARARLGPALAERVLLGDFFAETFADAPFDLIYERTFLCALPPALWPELVRRTAALLKPGGLLAGFFYFDGKEDGPPFGFAPGEDTRLYDEHFAILDDQPVTDSLPLFASRERWQVRRRKT